MWVRFIELDVSNNNIILGLICTAPPLLSGRLAKSVIAACAEFTVSQVAAQRPSVATWEIFWNKVFAFFITTPTSRLND